MADLKGKVSLDNIIAQAMKIPEQDFHWYAAFHNESHHPHIHMVAYSTGEEGFLTKYGIDDIKSAFATEIFQLDLQEIYQAQTQYRNDLRQVAKDYLENVHDLPQEAEEFTNLIPQGNISLRAKLGTRNHTFPCPIRRH